MTNFKVGQKVVCIKKGAWVGEKHPVIDNLRPTFDEIVTIKDICSDGYLILEEYEFDLNGIARSFNPPKFRPLAYSANATQEILSKFKPTEDTPDVEIKVHETAN